jgi:hypothetical protein
VIWAAMAYLLAVAAILGVLNVDLEMWVGFLYLGSLAIILREIEAAPIWDEFDE